MNWNSRNVLVTGVHGFFGPHIAKLLHEKGAHVIGGYHDKKKYSFCDLSGLSKLITMSYVDINDIGGSALYLLSDLAAAVTGEIHYVDAGYNKVGMPNPKNIT